MQDFNDLTISYSLFGDSYKYVRGMYENIKIAPEVYPGAKVVVYSDKPYEFEGAVNKVIGRSEGLQGSFWRYYEYEPDGTGHVIFRDADSLVGHREASLVSEWMESDKLVHTIHDHPEHTKSSVNMMAGMTGVKNGSLPYDFNHLIRWWVATKNPTAYRDEERFLNRFLWPYLRRYGLLHTSVVGSRFGGVRIPPADKPSEFIGSRAFV